jgi:hypothetical protein
MGGITPSSRILYAGGDEPGGHFAAAYLDFSRGPETEMWMYSTLEGRSGIDDPTQKTDGAQEGDRMQNDKIQKDGETKLTEAEITECEDHILAIVSGAKTVGREYGGRRGHPGGLLVGTLHTAVREALERRGVRVMRRQPWEYEKWMFRLDELPDGVGLPAGMKAVKPRDDDYAVVVSRSTVPRTAWVSPIPGGRSWLTRCRGTLKMLPGLVVKLDDGPPLAWAFLGGVLRASLWYALRLMCAGRC